MLALATGSQRLQLWTPEGASVVHVPLQGFQARASRGSRGAGGWGGARCQQGGVMRRAVSSCAQVQGLEWSKDGTSLLLRGSEAFCCAYLTA
jgi:hypothetical protein